MLRSVVLALVCCSCVLSATASKAKAVRGVNPEFESSYTGVGGTFTCLDGSRTIPFSRVNDDYCDCADGSDEPGKCGPDLSHALSRQIITM
jgi:protein kinase C substrate 80K-H